MINVETFAEAPTALYGNNASSFTGIYYSKEDEIIIAKQTNTYKSRRFVVGKYYPGTMQLNVGLGQG